MGNPYRSMLDAVLSHYSPSFRGPAESLGAAGGFSGAQFWRVRSPAGLWCLRRWPHSHPDQERLEYIHAVLRRVCDEGLRFIPRPVQTLDGKGFVPYDGALWELTPWMPGEADFHRHPRVEKLQSAMQALASFHCAARHYHSTEARLGETQGFRERLDRLASLKREDAARLTDAIRTQGAQAAADALAPMRRDALRWTELAFAIVDSILDEASTLVDMIVPVQPCIRDIWHDHVLFTGDEVTGIVDFGAMRNETPAIDVARLLRSLVGADAQQWSIGLTAYDASGRFVEQFGPVVRAFDRTAAILSGYNWVSWVFVEERQFAGFGRVADRLARCVEHLEHSVAAPRITY